jgi:MoaA/NifB/PqqE/SkfB family radical SAM enzyme
VNIGPGGDVWFCCPEWTTSAGKTRLGSIMESSLTDIWNGETARAIRRAMYANDLCAWCRTRGCPILNGNTRIAMDDIRTQFRGALFHESTVDDIRAGRDRLEGFPPHLIISNDWRCNLRCVMCDTTVYAKSGESYQAVATVTDRIFDEIEHNARWVKRIFFSGFGDPLAIRRHRRFLQHTTRLHPGLEIELLTNGVLLTPEVWETLKHNRFVTIRVSVDAATREVYEKIRKRGDWSVLLRNLRFLGELRRAGAIPGFEINMTVMRDNYHEVYDFLQFGLDLGCDCIGLQLIHGQLGNQNFLSPEIDWGTVKFLQTFLESETAQHPQYYVEYLRHLADLRMPEADAAPA